MDRSNDAGRDRNPGSSFNILNPAKKSHEFSRLRKKKSNSIGRSGNARNSRPSGELGEQLYNSPERGDTGQGVGLKARKDALRDAVKRIFGRRSRDIGISTVMSIGTPRHGYHHSEGAPAMPHNNAYQPYLRVNQVSPLDMNHVTSASPTMQSYARVQSPSTALFPKSAKLQPMDLGNPFERPSLRRRKTLPSVILSDREAAAVASVTAAMGSIKTHLDPESQADDGDAITTQSPNRRLNRLSRSTDDLRNLHLAATDTPRSRRDEIRYWRSSIGQAVSSPEGEEQAHERRQDGDDEQIEPDGRMLAAQSAGLTAQSAIAADHDHHQDISSTPAARLSSGFESDVESSKELEDRVARLEAGLQDFQYSLKRLTSHRDRHPDILGDGGDSRVIYNNFSKHTPNTLTDNLITSLQAPLSTDIYEYGYNYNAVDDALRPATSPQLGSRPRTPDFPPPLPTNNDLPNMSRPRNAAVPPVPGLEPDVQLAASPPSSPPPMKAPQYHHRHTKSIGSVVADRVPGRWTPQTESDHTIRPAERTISPQLEADDEIFRTFTSGHMGTIDNTLQDLQVPQEQPRQPSHTVQSLYQMLADERLARRRLEAQLFRLRAEITDLHQQLAVSTTSPATAAATPSYDTTDYARTGTTYPDDTPRNRNSQHNSIHTLPLHPTLTKVSNHSSSTSSAKRNSRHSAGSGNMRLREILRDVESSPPGTADAATITAYRRQRDREAEEERAWREQQAQRVQASRSKSSRKTGRKRDERIF
jgi:hypothetical protein